MTENTKENNKTESLAKTIKENSIDVTKTYAVVIAQGKQYTVQAGSKLIIDRLTTEPGQEVVLDNVLLIKKADGSVTVGSPSITGAKVTATVGYHMRGKKVRIFKKRIKQGYTKTIGHRQNLSYLTVKDIVA